jgi:hypothetical protein
VVEQPIRNRQVASSTLALGSILSRSDPDAIQRVASYPLKRNAVQPEIEVHCIPPTALQGNAPDGTVPGTYSLTISDLTNVTTPEPSVTILLGIGLVAVALVALRFKPNFGLSAN